MTENYTAWRKVTNAPWDDNVNQAMFARASQSCQYILVSGYTSGMNGLYKSLNYGATFSTISSITEIIGAAALSGNGQYAIVESVDPNTVLYKSSNTMSSWSSFDPDPTEENYHYYPYIYISQTGKYMLIQEWNLYAVLSKLLYSDDYGETFTDIAPIHPTSETYNYINGCYLSGDGKTILCWEYAMDETAKLYISINGGGSWTEVDTGWVHSDSAILAGGCNYNGGVIVVSSYSSVKVRVYGTWHTEDLTAGEEYKSNWTGNQILFRAIEGGYDYSWITTDYFATKTKSLVSALYPISGAGINSIDANPEMSRFVLATSSSYGAVYIGAPAIIKAINTAPFPVYVGVVGSVPVDYLDKVGTVPK